MAELIWNNVGQRYFETGIDRGVLYVSDGTGVAWNGLTSVTESPSGGEPTPYYIDGEKYLNVASRKEFGGTIEAFTYPDEFSEYDGWVTLDNGIMVDEQRRKSFGLSYRTRQGNDIDGFDHGYKLHLIYNALAAPTESAYETLNDDVEPLTFSWSFTTTPIRVVSNGNLIPLSHVVINSTKTNPTQMRFIEEYLYGTPSQTLIVEGYIYVSPGQAPMLPTLEEIFSLFENPMVTLVIHENPVTGISTSSESITVLGDLRGRMNEGLYVMADNSRLIETSASGLYTLEP
jgi:hypothetical protein